MSTLIGNNIKHKLLSVIQPAAPECYNFFFFAIRFHCRFCIILQADMLSYPVLIQHSAHLK